MSPVVAQVEAGQLDPSWLGGLFEVVEDTRDGPARTGFRLRGYTIPDEGKVRLVTETSTLAVAPDTVLRCYVTAAAPDRWTGYLPPGGQVAPSPGYAPGYAPGPVTSVTSVPAVPVPAPPVPVAAQPAAYPPPVPQGQPAGARGPAAPGRTGIAPAGPPPWQRPGGSPAAGQGWAQPGRGSGQ